jgi:hypothetical protein
MKAGIKMGDKKTKEAFIIKLTSCKTSKEFHEICEKLPEKLEIKELKSIMQKIKVKDIDLPLRKELLYFAFMHDNPSHVKKFACAKIDKEHYIDCFSIFIETGINSKIKDAVVFVCSKYGGMEKEGMESDIKVMTARKDFPSLFE